MIITFDKKEQGWEISENNDASVTRMQEKSEVIGDGAIYYLEKKLVAPLRSRASWVKKLSSRYLQFSCNINEPSPTFSPAAIKVHRRKCIMQ